MSVGKINDLVSEQALKQLDDLYAKLGIARNEMVSATEQAAKFTAQLADSTSIDNFNRAAAQATQSIQNVVVANNGLTQSQQQVVIATQAVIDATKANALADVNAIEVLGKVGGSFDKNIRTLVEYRQQLNDVNNQIKENNKIDAITVQGKQAVLNKLSELTKKQVELKEVIASQSLVIKQQVKDNNATSGSIDQMTARLNQLRKAYNTLSEEERNNAQVGGVLLKNIQELSASTTKANESQGKYNDSVGKYEEAIKSAISSYVPFGSQIVKGIDLANSAAKATDAAGAATAGFGGTLAAFTVTEFAIAITAATYYLSLFRDGAQKAEQFTAGLKNQFAALGSGIINGGFFDAMKQLAKGNPAGLIAGVAGSFNQGVDVQKQIQQVRNLNEVNDQLVAKKQGEADRDRAMSKNQQLSSDERIAYLKKAQKAENEIIDMQKDNAQANISAALNSSDIVKKLNEGQKSFLREGSEASIQYANQLVQAGKLTEAGYELLMQGYQKQTQALNSANMKLIRQQNDEAKIELKQAKDINTDQLELQKAKLADAQKTAKLILDDNKQSYSARLAALKIYVDRSNQLIDTELKIADAAPKISGTQKQTNAVKAGTAKKDVTLFDNSERLKIQKEAIKEFEDLYKSEYQQTLDDLQDSLNAQVLAIGSAEAQKAQTLNDAYLKGAINQKQYQDNLKLINDKANAEKIQAEIDTQEAIIGVQASLQAASAFTGLNIGSVSARAVQGSQNKLTGLKTQQIQNGIKSGNDSTANDRAEQIKKAQDIGKAINDVQQLQNFGESLLTAEYQKQIELLEQKKQAITDNAKQETEAVNNSIASEKTKQAQINVINKQAEQQQRQVDEQEKRIKKQQAVAQKAFNIASIIENTAVGVSLALAQGGLLFGVPFAAIVGALGAVQLATVLAQPLPQFEKGGTVAKDGKIITGEAGTELRIDPSGSLSLTAPYANVTHAKAGTKIISNKELMSMVGKPEQVMYVGGQSVDMKQVESLLKENNELQKQNKRQRSNVNVNVSDDWGFYKQQYFR